MYTQTKTIQSRKWPAGIILTAVIAAWLITAQHLFLSVHDSASPTTYAQTDSQWSIVYFSSGYTAWWLLDADTSSSGAQISWMDSLMEGIGEMRDDLMSLMPLPWSGTIIASWWATLSSWLSSTSSTDVIPVSDRPLQCEKIIPRDVVLATWDAISRALDHCLIEWDDDNNIFPDAILTHAMMLTIADRAWFAVDLKRWSAQWVSSDDLKRFLDYLIVSKQIDGVPAQLYNKTITRREYLTLLRAIIPDRFVLPTATVLEIDLPATITTPTTAPSSSMSVAVFKQKLNTRLANPLTIMSYDANIIATPEIQQSILMDLINGWLATVPTHGAAPTNDHQNQVSTQPGGIGINTETLKLLLWWLLQEI